MNLRHFRRLFYILTIVGCVVFGVTAVMAIRALGNIDEIEEAAEDLELRQFRIAAQLRSQVYRLNSTALRFEITKLPEYAEDVTEFQAELTGYIEEQTPVFDSAAEIVLLKKFRDDLSRHFVAIDQLVTEVSTGTELSSKSLARHALLQERSETLTELAIELGNSRKQTFRTALSDYRSSVSELQWFIVIFMLVLSVALAGLIYLGYRVFLRPLKVQVAEAEEQAEKMGHLATLGTLSSGIAHEIRNPLSAIKARLYALQELSGAESPATRQAEVIEHEVGRIERIVHDFLDFARPMELDLKTVQLPDFLRKVVEIVQPDLEEGDVKLIIPDEIAPMDVRIDPDQIQQILVNLIRNGIEACEGNPDDRPAEISLDVRPDESSIAIVVEDNGAGILEDIRDRIFEPFFSKKPAGTGLGLPISRGIAQRHGGDLVVEFEDPEPYGSAFKLTILRD